MTDESQATELDDAVAKAMEISEKMAFGEIKSDNEYKKALKRVDELMNAKPGTREGAELNELADKVVAYEEKHHEI